MAGVKQEQTEGQAVIRAKDWVRHTLMKYGMKMEDTAKMSQADAEAMLEACREKKRLSTEKPATESQLAELEKLGIRPSENMTVKQASDAMRDHFRSQAPPATPKQMAWLQAHRLGEGVVTSAEASRVIARYIAKEEITRYTPPKAGNPSPKDIYLTEAKRQYEENERSFRNFDEIGAIQKMMASGVGDASIRSVVSVYSPVNAKCTEKQLDYLVGLSASDKKVKNMAEENRRTVRPPSEKQLALMKKKGIPYTKGMSGLQASALIARKVNLERLQDHKPDLAKESNPIEFYRSFAQAELRAVGWDVAKYTDTKAVTAMHEHGFSKKDICSTLDANSPKCGQSLPQWLERNVTGTIERYERQKEEAAKEAAKEAFAKETAKEEAPAVKLGKEVPYEPDRKYEMTTIAKSQEGMLLHRIRALKDIPAAGVKKGDFGGYVLGEKNLSHQGDCWIGEEAAAFRDAIVCENAVVCGNAVIADRAVAAGEAWVDGDSRLEGRAVVVDQAVISGHAVVTDNGLVCMDGYVTDFACLKGEGFVNGKEDGLQDKEVRDNAPEGVKEYRETLQESYRDLMNEERIEYAIGGLSLNTQAIDPNTVVPVKLERPERPGLESAGQPQGKTQEAPQEKKVVRKKEAKEKDGEKKPAKPRKRS